MWPGPAGGAREHVERRRLDALPRAEEHAPSRFPCTPRSSPTASQPQSSGIRQSSPITSPPASRICSSSVAVPVPKWIVGQSDGGEDPRRVRLHELDVVGRRERADPGVEELDHVGAGPHLAADVARERVGELLHQRVPQLRLGVHQPLHVQELAARLALDQVAGDRERAAAEADHRLVGAELAAHDRDRLEDERHRLLRLGDAQRVDLGAACGSGRRSPGRRSRRARRRRPSRAAAA